MQLEQGDMYCKPSIKENGLDIQDWDAHNKIWQKRNMSAVIPAIFVIYNAGELLRSCVDSLLKYVRRLLIYWLHLRWKI